VPVQLREDDRQVEDGQKRRDEVRVKLEQRALAHLQQVIILFSNHLARCVKGSVVLNTYQRIMVVWVAFILLLPMIDSFIQEKIVKI
jgi:hypothetical protein